MANKEFFSPISNDVDIIRDSTKVIDQNVKEIKNTDLSNVNDKIGTSTDTAGTNTLFGKIYNVKTLPEKYPNLNNDYNGYFSVSAGSTATVISITGKGAIFNAWALESTDSHIELLIDGVQKHYSLMTDTYTGGGFIQTNDLHYGGTYTNILKNYAGGAYVSTRRAYPFIASSSDTSVSATGTIYLNKPILFNQSFEMKITNNTTASVDAEIWYDILTA